MARQRAAQEAAQEAEIERLRELYNSSPEFRAKVDRANYAIEYCANQGSIANSMAPGGIVKQAFASIEVQSSCIDFYKRTGHLPGQPF